MNDQPDRYQTTSPLVGPLADLIADIVEADGTHAWDDGFCEQLRRDGYTTEGKRRLVEQMRARAVAEQKGKIPIETALERERKEREDRIKRLGDGL